MACHAFGDGYLDEPEKPSVKRAISGRGVFRLYPSAGDNQGERDGKGRWSIRFTQDRTPLTDTCKLENRRSIGAGRLSQSGGIEAFVPCSDLDWPFRIFQMPDRGFGQGLLTFQIKLSGENVSVDRISVNVGTEPHVRDDLFRVE